MGATVSVDWVAEAPRCCSSFDADLPSIDMAPVSPDFRAQEGGWPVFLDRERERMRRRAARPPRAESFGFWGGRESDTDLDDACSPVAPQHTLPSLPEDRPRTFDHGRTPTAREAVPLELSPDDETEHDWSPDSWRDVSPDGELSPGQSPPQRLSRDEGPEPVSPLALMGSYFQRQAAQSGTPGAAGRRSRATSASATSDDEPWRSFESSRPPESPADGGRPQAAVPYAEIYGKHPQLGASFDSEGEAVRRLPVMDSLTSEDREKILVLSQQHERLMVSC